ncbi:nitroreductase family deazaflavin-dependent oxidoreductase [Micromonospora sp. NPDC049460]|uniref:nitroreductase family deazaflavin-dependent oxidoreductase n=1 Tax=unclassified Micromonospora TaxID=2617518 RepID=UPI00371B08BD
MNQLDVLVYEGSVVVAAPRCRAEGAGASQRQRHLASGRVTAYRRAEYLVSMLGPDANWVRNVQAAGGRAALRRRGRETPILIEEIASERRAEILRRYLAAAPGARAHLGLGPAAPLPESRRIAPRHPVFRIRECPVRAPT